MSSLAEPATRDSLLARLGKLHPERPRAWGRMTPNEMLCHLADSVEAGLGERSVTPVDTWMRRTVLKYAALRTSYAWPQGLETRPEVEPDAGGTPPVDFERDRARLVAL